MRFPVIRSDDPQGDAPIHRRGVQVRGGVRFAPGTVVGRVVPGVLGDVTMVARIAFLIVRRRTSTARTVSVRAVAAALAHGPRHPHQCDHRDKAPDRVQGDGRPCGEEHAVEGE